jgi:hypothetical protein
MTETTTEKPATPIAPKTARFSLPTGVATPIELRNYLVKEGIAHETLKPQQMYAYVKSPGKSDPFPVKFYDEEGNVYDKASTEVLTRPGIPGDGEKSGLEVGAEWYVRRNTKAATTTAAASAATTTVAGAEDETDAADESGNTEDAPAGDFEEAE